MFTDRDQLPLGKVIDPVLHCTHGDPSHPADGMQAGPAVALAPGAAHEIGIDFECVWIKVNLKYLVRQYVEVFLGTAVQTQGSTSVRSSIH